MRVGDILESKETRIITVRLREPVEVAARLMKSENVSALVVKDVCRTEGNVVAGMFSERDIARAVVDHGAAALQMRVEQLMSKMLFSCGPDDDLRHVLGLMVKHNIRHIPVLSEHVLVGLISARDIIELRLKELDEQTESAGAQANS
ncbi:MAG: CBS domain-containing protein [Halofilum sp. (in: g-proteobacteria)]